MHGLVLAIRTSHPGEEFCQGQIFWVGAHPLKFSSTPPPQEKFINVMCTVCYNYHKINLKKISIKRRIIILQSTTHNPKTVAEDEQSFVSSLVAHQCTSL